MSGDSMYKLRFLDVHIFIVFLLSLFFFCVVFLVLFQIWSQGYVHFFKGLGRIKGRIMHESGVLQTSERVRV
jgi:hypothetical protein